MKNLYDEDYFERGLETGKSGYSNYRWIPELTIPLAVRIVEHLGISTHEKILDFGCAKGYLVKALRLIQRNAYGYDISPYAISCAPEDVAKYVFSGEIAEHYDWIISKDVFEHIPYAEIDSVLADLGQKCKRLFCVVPLGQDGRYVIPAYELDVTHVIREPLDWWAKKLEGAGFVVENMTYQIGHIKQNWSQYKFGNGFFTCRSVQQ